MEEGKKDEVEEKRDSYGEGIIYMYTEIPDEIILNPSLTHLDLTTTLTDRVNLPGIKF